MIAALSVSQNPYEVQHLIIPPLNNALHAHSRVLPGQYTVCYTSTIGSQPIKCWRHIKSWMNSNMTSYRTPQIANVSDLGQQVKVKTSDSL